MHELHQLVLEHADRGNLEMFLRATLPQLSDCARLCMMRDVAEGLAAIHTAGFIHRDPEPKNLLVKTDREADHGITVKWIDFGSAMLIDDVKDRLLEAPKMSDYVDPQLENRPIYGEFSDTYAFGMLLGRVVKKDMRLSRQGIEDNARTSLAMRLAWKCVQPEIAMRPSMRAVAHEFREHGINLLDARMNHVKFRFEIELDEKDEF
jgi:serine/threonine protein kinase